MKYIDKKNLTSANIIIDKYLTHAKIKPGFVNDDLYKKFTNKDGKRNLVDQILLREQDYRCCYCMKKFSPSIDSDITIEHLIPRSTPYGNELKYFATQYPGLNDTNVCHTQDYKSGTSINGQYPHHVAYHNFSIACHDCNEERKDKYIVFPFLLPSISSHIIYNRTTGKISWMDDPQIFNGFPAEEWMVNILNLNSSELKAIRAVWFFGKDNPTVTYSTPDTVRNLKDRKELIYRTFDAILNKNPNVSLRDMEAFISLETEERWSNLLKYNYFGTI
ncbi:MAG: hypothetical protein MJZ11_13195 [Lachnospiraceae bacterium]|nr:hypothetical protein [Lachnospiraceae bacterium]